MLWKVEKVKQISLQINGLNVKLVKAERKGQTDLFTDQWFKYKTCK